MCNCASFVFLCGVFAIITKRSVILSNFSLICMYVYITFLPSLGSREEKSASEEISGEARSRRRRCVAGKTRPRRRSSAPSRRPIGLGARVRVGSVSSARRFCLHRMVKVKVADSDQLDRCTAIWYLSCYGLV